jgi:adenosylcobalamin-dependent ribonucleoside-triphosphate reductase
LDDALDNDSPTEEYVDTVLRVINACDQQLNCKFTKDEEYRLAEYLLSLKASVGGRFLWQLGTDTVERFGLASLQNCAFTTVDHPIRPFTWCMDMLALGSGVGYNIQREHVDKLPMVKEWFSAPSRFDDGGADFIVPDSREGWVRLLGKTLKAAFLSHSPSKGTFTFSTQAIRGKGSPIRGFGGVASGPEDLCWGIEEISKVLMKRRGRKIRPIDALDVMNIIAQVIVAGNVRRSAQIAIGDPDDVEFLLAKRWDMGHIPKWRSMSNNSVVCGDIADLHDYFWDGYEGKGEPYGLINLNLSKTCGRLGETQYPDPNINGYNPCAEQPLENYETCCLSSTHLPNINSYEELLDILELFYRINKHSLLLPSHHPETEEVVHKNMRMGIAMGGLLQATDEQRSWLSPAYEHLRKFDVEYSDRNYLPHSIKLTTVKPDGTASLLPGITPGVHPAYAQYMYRRITISSEHPLVDICRKNGYPIEYRRNLDGTDDYGSYIVTFPYSYPEGTKLAENMTALDQLKEVKSIQKDWSDNSVSCTVYYRKEEIPEIKKYLEKNYKKSHKSLSFLLHQEHGFDQAPYEEVPKEDYDALVNDTNIITSIDSADFEGVDECAGGGCPIK